MDISGILHAKSETHQISEKFKKRDFVLKDQSSQYPQFISFQLTQDKTNLIDQYAVGSEIKVHFNMRGREWHSPQGETKYFNTLECWRIEGITNLQVETYQNKQTVGNTDYSAEKIEDSKPFTSADADDLPF